MAPRRWLLFGLALGSLVLLTYAGVLLAFSVPVTAEVARANPTLEEGSRAIVVPIVDPNQVATHESSGEAALLAAGDAGGSFPSSARDVTMGRALAYVSPGANGTYSPATLELADVPTANGTQNLTIDLAALGAQGDGWILMGASAAEPRFVPAEDVLGVVARTESTASLGLLFASGALGFFAPLAALVATHRGGARPGSPVAVCRECRAPLPKSADFCLRCGAYRTET